VQRSLQRNFAACADAFTPKGCVVTSLAMGDYFIKYQVTPCNSIRCSCIQGRGRHHQWRQRSLSQAAEMSSKSCWWVQQTL